MVQSNWSITQTFRVAKIHITKVFKKNNKKHFNNYKNNKNDKNDFYNKCGTIFKRSIFENRSVDSLDDNNFIPDYRSTGIFDFEVIKQNQNCDNRVLPTTKIKTTNGIETSTGTISEEFESIGSIQSNTIPYNDSNDNEVVTQLVMDKFGTTLQRISIRRSQRRTLLSPEIEKHLENDQDTSKIGTEILSNHKEAINQNTNSENSSSVDTYNISTLLTSTYRRFPIVEDCFNYEDVLDKEQFPQSFKESGIILISNSDESSYVEVEQNNGSAIYSDLKEQDNSFTHQNNGNLKEQITVNPSSESKLSALIQISEQNKSTPQQETPKIDQPISDQLDLLISSHHQSISKTLFSQDANEYCNEIPAVNITINNFKMLVNEAKAKSFHQYFVGIFTCGTEVVRTDIVPRRNEENCVHFKGDWSFKDLKSDFKINLKVYSLHIRKETLKNWIRRKSKFFIFRKQFQMLPSHFEYWGETNFNCSTVQSIVQKPLFRSKNFYIDTWILLHFFINLKINIPQSGFLDIAKESTDKCLIWDRQWFSLDGFHLKCWHYPTESEDHQPLLSIDLRNCLNVYKATKQECFRGRTLILEMQDSCNYYLSVDTIDDLLLWKKALDLTITTLRKWTEFKRDPPIKLGHVDL